MSDVFWAAIISGGTAIVVTLLTQWLSLRIASQQLKHTERTEQLKWERSEASRKEAEQDVRLREFWGHILACKVHMLRWQVLSDKGRKEGMTDMFDSERPSFHAFQAHISALIGLTGLSSLAQEYVESSVELEGNLQRCDATSEGKKNTDAAWEAWTRAYQDIEHKVGELTHVASA